MRLTRFLKLSLYTLIFTAFLVTPLLACSEIYYNKGGKVNVSARNFDFNKNNGYIRFTPTGIAGESQYAPKGCTPFKWVVKYPNVTFNIFINKGESTDDGCYGAGVDGTNTQGLKIGTYFLASSKFPQDDKKVTLDIGTLMQYLLDDCKNVDECINSIEGGAYRVTSLPGASIEIKLHLYIHDSSGASAIVEFVDGKAVITRNPEIPVLTNTIYSQSLKDLRLYKGFGGDKPIPGGEDTLDRFVRGAYYWKHLVVPENDRQAVNYGFAAIQTLSVPPRLPGGCTWWSIVTDINNKMVFFRTADNAEIAWIDLEKLAKSAHVSSDIDLLRTDLKGEVNNFFDRENAFNPSSTPTAPDYSKENCWAQLPGINERKKPVDVFFVHPTVFFHPNTWNECIEANRQNPKMTRSLKAQAGAYAQSCNIYAPRYRDANIKVLSLSEEERNKALEVAYSDVEGAFDYYLKNLNRGRPFILAGHSQGSNLLLWLLKRKFKNPDLRNKMIAAYLIGWSVTGEDLKKYPYLKMSSRPEETGCIISYNTQSAKPSRSIVLKGAVGVNPLTMDLTPENISKEKNLGAVFFQGDEKIEIPHFTGGQTVNGAFIIPVPTRTDLVPNAACGFYHPYDYTFFFRNVEENVKKRIDAFIK